MKSGMTQKFGSEGHFWDLKSSLFGKHVVSVRSWYSLINFASDSTYSEQSFLLNGIIFGIRPSTGSALKF
jgi:hypothetical protein